MLYIYNQMNTIRKEFLRLYYNDYSIQENANK